MAYLIDPVLRQTRLRDPQRYMELGEQLVAHPSVALVRAAAGSIYPSQPDAGLQHDLLLLALFSRHHDRWVRRACIFGLQRMIAVLKQTPNLDHYIRTAVQIVLAMDVGSDTDLADELCEIFGRHYLGSYCLSESEVQQLLTKLITVHDLDKHSIGEFLSSITESHAASLCDFLLARIKCAQDLRSERNWDYRAVPYSFSGTNFHRLKSTDRYGAFLRTIRDMLPATDYERDLTELFWRIGTLDDETLGVLDEWLHIPEKVKYVIDLLSKAISKLAFSKPWFAFHILEAGSQEPELLDRAISRLVWNAMPHSLTGTPGQPPPALVDVQERAGLLRDTYSDIPLAVRLFTAIESAAVGDVRRHVLEGEEFNE